MLGAVGAAALAVGQYCCNVHYFAHIGIDLHGSKLVRPSRNEWTERFDLYQSASLRLAGSISYWMATAAVAGNLETASGV